MTVLSGDSECGRHVGIINGKKVKIYQRRGLLWHNIHTMKLRQTVSMAYNSYSTINTTI
jgi:hypothetical protein